MSDGKGERVCQVCGTRMFNRGSVEVCEACRTIAAIEGLSDAMRLIADFIVENGELIHTRLSQPTYLGGGVTHNG